jgi:hypothetical protein
LEYSFQIFVGHHLGPPHDGFGAEQFADHRRLPGELQRGREVVGALRGERVSGGQSVRIGGRRS